MLACAALAAAVAMTACGGGADKEASALSEQSIAKARALDAALVSHAEIEKERVGSVRRSFLSFWATLQFQAWDEAENYFADGLRAAIGTQLLADSLEAQAVTFRTSKPIIRGVTTSRGRAVIHFIANDSEGNPVPLSISWTRVAGGRWRVVYFPTLNGALSFAAQERRRMEVSPLSKSPPPDAVKAGYDAAHLQSRYLARLQAALSSNATGALPNPVP